ncbi:dTMP kinase [Candidatus Gribaldobacteria bacterium]|nr:dTMP kinase [Candidatus Gribaldobacteria bacterium]
MDYQGKFIVFEGLDGSGQSTQVGLLAKYLEQKGRFVLRTKEPTNNSPFALKIRQILSEKEKANPADLQNLFAQDRGWHLQKVIIPDLHRGEIVLSDRYMYSSLAFGMASGVNKEKIEELNKDFLKPDLVFFIKTEPKICLERIIKRGKQIDLFEKLPILERVFKNYCDVLERNKSLNVAVIDGNKSIDEVFQQIKEKLATQLF